MNCAAQAEEPADTQAETVSSANWNFPNRRPCRLWVQGEQLNRGVWLEVALGPPGRIGW